MDAIPDHPAEREQPSAGGRPMNLLRLAALQAAVDEALVEGMVHCDRIAGTAWQETLRQHVHERLPALLRAQGRQVRGVARSEVEAELEGELRAARRERDRFAADLEEMTAKLAHLRRTGAIQRRAIARELEVGGRERAEHMRKKLRVLLGQEGGHGAPRGQLRADLEALVVEAWHDGRRWVEEIVNEESDRRIDQFDRRIRKLNAQLAEKEEALERALATDAGLRSGYRHVQGLAEDDSEFSIKRKLLEGVLEQNLILKSS